MNPAGSREYRLILAALVVVCGLGFAAAVWPAVAHAMTLAVTVAAATAGGALLAWVGRQVWAEVTLAREYRAARPTSTPTAPEREGAPHDP